MVASAMTFGRNPHVLKAQAAEQRAVDAPDALARVLAYRDAAHQWERAAAREAPGKRRAEYEQHAARNRELADEADGDAPNRAATAPAKAPPPPDSLLN